MLDVGGVVAPLREDAVVQEGGAVDAVDRCEAAGVDGERMYVVPIQVAFLADAW